jgi:enoyl-CoA hydratase/carnithine racemase
MAKAEFRLEGDVGEIVIADPPLNLFDIDLSRDVARAAAEAAGSDARAVLLRAEGDNFSAGVDVDLFVGRDAAAARDLISEFMPAIRRFAEIEVPTVAAVQGLCLTAGFEIALSCDLIWASDDAQFGLVEAVIGATPFGGGTQRLVARAGAGRAAEAILNPAGSIPPRRCWSGESSTASSRPLSSTRRPRPSPRGWRPARRSPTPRRSG